MSHTNTFDDRLNDFINTHPRESLWAVAFVLMLVWQTIPALIGLILYVVLIRLLKINRWLVMVLAGVFALQAVYLSQHHLNAFAFTSYLKLGFSENKQVWKLLLANNPIGALNYTFHHDFLYLLGSPLVMLSIFSLIELIHNSPHEEQMRALKVGSLESETKELSEKAIANALKKIKDTDPKGAVLGVSKYSGKRVMIPDRFINQVALVLGTTGSGKTVTLRRFYKRAITQGYPLIIVDGKPDEGNIGWLMDCAARNNRRFIGFNCGNFYSYDALAHGNFTELKDKIICLKDQWENDYYRSIAEDYLQTSFEVLLKIGKPINLKDVVDCLAYTKLKLLAAETKVESLIERVKELKNYERKDITGLQAHLNILINSELGQFFNKAEKSFSLTEVIDEQAVVYFALPALRFPSFAKVLGKLVINDIKAVIDHKRAYKGPIFTIFDEFSVFAGEQVLNLVNMGRGKGVHAIFGTQGLADLDKIDISFKNQVLNCVNTLICHQLNDHSSTEEISKWTGTQNTLNYTSQVNSLDQQSLLGSVRKSKEFMIHPDEIKQGLKVGEAFCVSKVGGFNKDKMKVISI